MNTIPGNGPAPLGTYTSAFSGPTSPCVHVTSLVTAKPCSGVGFPLTCARNPVTPLNTASNAGATNLFIRMFSFLVSHPQPLRGKCQAHCMCLPSARTAANRPAFLPQTLAFQSRRSFSPRSATLAIQFHGHDANQGASPLRSEYG